MKDCITKASLPRTDSSGLINVSPFANSKAVVEVYGGPSVKTAWYARAERAGPVPRSVFWPVPNVDSGLVRLVRTEPPPLPAGVDRADVFAVIDAAFAQRRKMLRSALAAWAGSVAAAESVLVRAHVDPRARAETLDVAAFARIASART